MIKKRLLTTLFVIFLVLTVAGVSATVDSDKAKADHSVTLTIRVNGDGSTNPPPGPNTIGAALGDDAKHGPLGGDSMITITAYPNSGWQFDGWDGDVADPNSTRTTVFMDHDKVVTANFSEVPSVTATLTIAVNGNGSTTPTVGEREYSEGEAVTITATAASGWQFDNWTGDVANPNSATTTVTIDASKTVTVNFSETTPNPDKETPLNMWLIIGSVLGVLVVFGGVVYYFVRRVG